MSTSFFEKGLVLIQLLTAILNKPLITIGIMMIIISFLSCSLGISTDVFAAVVMVVNGNC